MANSWLDPAWKPARNSTIVFVHGAIVNGHEMMLLRHRLAQLGYGVRQFHYQSMRRGLDENVERLHDFINSTQGETVHVIGHSMGGVLGRNVFERMPDPRPGRIIAVGSPLVDCWVGRRFHLAHEKWGLLLAGKTVRDHLEKPSDPRWRGTRDFGVIAGTYPFGVGTLFSDLPTPSDGVVLLRETQLEGLRDHVTYRLNHFAMLLSRRCCLQMARFLALGSFAAVNP